ncbi:MAG: F0F1 ATP synthase subunit delta [Opitutaceae bacterium]|jgi:F-type H+-transporting ATPase subunit delta
MASGKKQITQLAQKLFKLSFADGRLSEERVAGVLAYVEKNPPAKPIPVLRAYGRLVAIEVAKGRAVVEHSGPVADSALQSIAAAMTGRYKRPVVATAKPNASLLAGLRIRVGDDVYESSVSGQLAALSASA